MSKLAERNMARTEPIRGVAHSTTRMRSISTIPDYMEPRMPNADAFSRFADAYLNAYATTETRPQFASWLRFNILANTLFVETRYLGNPARILQHPAYSEIKTMGKTVLPFVFSRIEAEPNLWLVALRDMTGARPVKRWNEGNVSSMVSDWKRWAKSRGLLQQSR